MIIYLTTLGPQDTKCLKTKHLSLGGCLLFM